MKLFLVTISIAALLLGKTEAESECVDTAERKCGNTFLEDVENPDIHCIAYGNGAQCVDDIIEECSGLSEEELNELDMTITFLLKMGKRCEKEENQDLDKRGRERTAFKRTLMKRGFRRSLMKKSYPSSS